MKHINIEIKANLDNLNEIRKFYENISSRKCVGFFNY